MASKKIMFPLPWREGIKGRGSFGTFYEVVMMGQQKTFARGFTLIEIMVALTVMGFAVVSLVQLFSSNLRMIGRSQDYMTALTQAESVMRGIVESDKIEEKSWKEETDQGYQVEASVSETQKERTENLPIKLLQIELVFSWEKAFRKKSMTFRTLTVVNKIDNRGVADQK